MGVPARFTLPLCLVLLAGLAPLSETRPATLVVDASGGTGFTTIQSAIDAAVPGQDDVFVRCGVYVERVVMRPGVSLRGESRLCAIIDGAGAGTTVTMPGLGADTVLEGFTVRNGRSELGAGIFVDTGSPVITHNLIRDNIAPLATSFGGGIGVQGQIGDEAQTAPLISYNVIASNFTVYIGSAVFLSYSEGARVTTNVIVDNEIFAGVGGAVGLLDASGVIVNNTMLRNGGGGIYTNAAGTVVVANNVIAESAWGYGVFLGGATSLTLRNNDVFDNQPVDWFGIPDPTGTDGNISADPGLVEPRLDGVAGFFPRSDSPLVDAGSNVFAEASDLRGIPRPFDGDADGAAVSDIGARENEGLTGLSFTSGVDLEWHPGSHAGGLYALFRGDLAELVATGVYTQDPLAVPAARHFCSLDQTTLGDGDVPDPGDAFFYLVRAAGLVPGSLGFDSQPIERPQAMPCRDSGRASPR